MSEGDVIDGTGGLYGKIGLWKKGRFSVTYGVNEQRRCNYCKEQEMMHEKNNGKRGKTCTVCDREEIGENREGM